MGNMEAPRQYLAALLPASDEATCNTGAEFNIDGGTLAGSAAAPGPAE